MWWWSYDILNYQRNITSSKFHFIPELNVYYTSVLLKLLGYTKLLILTCCSFQPNRIIHYWPIIIIFLEAVLPILLFALAVLKICRCSIFTSLASTELCLPLLSENQKHWNRDRQNSSLWHLYQYTVLCGNLWSIIQCLDINWISYCWTLFQLK